MFAFQQRPSDICNVLVQDLSLEDSKELWVFIHDSFPFAFSDGVSFALSFGLVDEDLSFVEADVECSNYCSCTHSHLESLLLVDFVTDVVFSLFDKQDLIDFIQLNVNSLLPLKDPWFKAFEYLDHKVLVHHVVPFVICMFNLCFSFFSVLIRDIHWKVEELPKANEEDAEQEVTVDFSLDMTWQLLNQLLIFFCTDSLVLVIDPSVVEVLFDFVFVFN